MRQVEKGGSLDKVYIGVDDAPAPLAEVVDWLREYLGVTEWADDASVRRAGSADGDIRLDQPLRQILPCQV